MIPNNTDVITIQHTTPDVYLWCVIYRDGSHIREDDHPNRYNWKVAQQQGKSIKEVWLLLPDQSVDYGHVVSIPEDAEPVFFRRRYTTISLNGPITGAETPQKTVHCIGWKQGEQGLYLFVFENGSTLLSNNFQAI